MNQIAEGAFITAERVGCIEIHLTLAADRTEVPLIQGKGFYKRCSAAAAGVGGVQTLRQLETGGTDRDARDSAKGQLTEPAFIRKNEIEKTSGQRLDTGQQRPPAPSERRHEMCSRETREGSPPLKHEYTTSSSLEASEEARRLQLGKALVRD
jgi:hypothetical protein